MGKQWDLQTIKGQVLTAVLTKCDWFLISVLATGHGKNLFKESHRELIFSCENVCTKRFLSR